MRRVALVLAVLLLAGCNAPAPATTTPPTSEASGPPTGPGGAKLGFAFSPKSTLGPAFEQFIVRASQNGEVVLWGGPIEQVVRPGAAPSDIATLAHRRGLEVAIQTSILKEGEQGPLDEANLTAWREGAAAFAKENAPEYFALGVEVNRFVDDAERFDAFVAWYDETYDAVKAVAPETKVFVTFQYEWMEGRRGGLFGGEEAAPSQWDLLDRFPKRDLTAFTTYPGLVLQNPHEGPDDYYANLSKAAGPIAITEVAHFRDAPAPGWESSDEEQARFVERLFALLEPVKPALLVWLHLYDQPNVSPAPFRAMGLIDANDEPRPALEAWRSFEPK